MLWLTGNKDVEVRPDKRLLFCSNDLQNFVDVGLGNLVAGVWHRGMTLTLAYESLTFLSLGWYLDDLVIDHTIRQRYCGEKRQ